LNLETQRGKRKGIIRAKRFFVSDAKNKKTKQGGGTRNSRGVSKTQKDQMKVKQ